MLVLHNLKMAVSRSVDVKPRAKMTKLTKNNKKPTKKVLIIAQELKFAKTLAGNNKTLRDRALKRLKKWFDARESQMPFTENDFMRVWKGLHYYMWMSDKPLTQEECASNISKLISFKSEETSLLFFKCFLQTMINEWFGIDHLRLDKFLMLVRRVLRQALTVLCQSDWEPKILTYFQDILNETVLKLDSAVPLSFNMHITEIYLEELAKISKGKLSEDQVLEFIRPFAWQLAHSKDARQSQHIKSHIFRYLMRQSDAGLEYQERFNAWRQLGFPGGTIESMERVELDNMGEEVENDMEESMESDSPLDPRAGKVHVELPQLKFDPSQIAEMLEDLRYKPSTNTKSRRALVALAEQFKELANGNYPLGMKKIRTKPKNNGPSINMKSSLKRLQSFDRQILGNSKKAKSARQKSRKIRDIVNKELEKYKNIELEKPAESIDEFVARSEEGIFNTDLVKNNTKKSISPIQKRVKDSKKRKSVNKVPEQVEKRFKRNSGVWEVNELQTSILNSSSTSDWEEEKLEKPNKTNKGKKNKTNLPAIIESKMASNSISKVKKGKKTQKDVELLLTPTRSPKLRSSSTPLVKNPFSSPVSSTKKVKIALNLNRSQDHREYHQSLASSPGIPYDATRKPMKPLLKPKPCLQNSLNPFYKN